MESADAIIKARISSVKILARNKARILTATRAQTGSPHNHPHKLYIKPDLFNMSNQTFILGGRLCVWERICGSSVTI